MSVRNFIVFYIPCKPIVISSPNRETKIPGHSISGEWYKKGAGETASSSSIGTGVRGAGKENQRPEWLPLGGKGTVSVQGPWSPADRNVFEETQVMPAAVMSCPKGGLPSGVPPAVPRGGTTNQMAGSCVSLSPLCLP